jgi:RNA polymerase sigma-70 factor (TIGR02960 family)
VRQDRFQGRASVRAWLYRIATKSLDLLRENARRPPELSMTTSSEDFPEPTGHLEASWPQPYPDMLLDEILDDSPDPAARYEGKETIALAFVVALQSLPPRQRVTLLLRDVLGFQANEVADMLDTTETSVHSAVRRARETLDARLSASRRERAPLPNSPAERATVGRFVEAFEAGEIADVVALLTEDATFTMPPEPLEYQGLRRLLDSSPTVSAGAVIDASSWLRRGRTLNPPSVVISTIRTPRSLARTG